VFIALASPIFVAFASFGHEGLGFALSLGAYVALTTAYLLPTRGKIRAAADSYDS